MQTRACLLLLLMSFACAGLAAPVGTAFTDLGELKQLGTPANGPYDDQGASLRTADLARLLSSLR